MVQFHFLNRLGQAHGFGGVEGNGLFLEVNVAVGAGTGAAGSHNQKSCGAAVEAFADVGAGGFFADGVEVQVAEDVLHCANALHLGGFDSQPIGFHWRDLEIG